MRQLALLLILVFASAFGCTITPLQAAPPQNPEKTAKREPARTDQAVVTVLAPDGQVIATAGKKVKPKEITSPDPLPGALHPIREAPLSEEKKTLAKGSVTGQVAEVRKEILAHAEKTPPPVPVTPAIIDLNKSQSPATPPKLSPPAQRSNSSEVRPPSPPVTPKPAATDPSAAIKPLAQAQAPGRVAAAMAQKAGPLPRLVPPVAGPGPEAKIAVEAFGDLHEFDLEVGVPYAIRVDPLSRRVVTAKLAAVSRDETSIIASTQREASLFAAGKENVLRVGWSARLTAVTSDGRPIRVTVALRAAPK